MNFQLVEQYLSSLEAKYGLVGVDCKVMRNHEVLFRRSCGYRDAERTKPVTPKDLYDVFSCTKVITMTAAMQCVERGLFQLDDPVEKYLPAFQSMKVVDHFEKCWPRVWPTLQDPTHLAPTKPTIRQMMSMTSGISSYDLDSETVNLIVSFHLFDRLKFINMAHFLLPKTRAIAIFLKSLNVSPTVLRKNCSITANPTNARTKPRIHCQEGKPPALLICVMIKME